jgi:hypothetical protein
MSEEQPEERMESDSENHPTGNETEEPIGSASVNDPVEDTAEPQLRTESEDSLGGDSAEQQIVPDSADPSADSADEELESLPDGEAMETTEESRLGRFFKRALRWVVVVLVIFTLGVVAMQIVRVGPLVDERNNLDQSLAEAQATQQDLQAELNRLEGVEAENEELTRSLQQSEARLAVLNILVDVTRAQLALAQEDTDSVAAALQETGEKLNLLRDLVGAGELDGLRERLVLVLSEVDGDPFAAERDLEILANTLLEIERELATD